MGRTPPATVAVRLPLQNFRLRLLFADFEMAPHHCMQAPDPTITIEPGASPYLRLYFIPYLKKKQVFFEKK